MQKALIIQRTEGDEWYRKAKEFLSKNKCKPLALQISNDFNTSSIFQEAVASLTLTAEQEFNIDADAAVFLVIADLTKQTEIASAECLCKCNSPSGCGGGGGGHLVV
jgi:hypothetical protein